jgi:hypothetical protein
VLGYFLVNVVVSAVLPPALPGDWLTHLAVDIGFTLVWYFALLYLAGKPERYNQTATATFGYQAVLAPLWLAAVWLVGRFAESPALQLPVTLMVMLLLVWTVVVAAHILRSALEWTLAPAIALVILQILLGQILIFYLFPAPA